MNTTLCALQRLLNDKGIDARLLGASEEAPCPLDGADCDSRLAAPNHLFICKGVAFKPAYLADALAKGCTAYLCDQSHADELATTAPDAPALVVPDADLRRAMALVSAEAWGHPDRDLTVIGITGTKGKSTCSYMLRSILDAGHERPQAALIGSIQTFDGIEDLASVNTTPEAPDLWRHVANARKAGLPYLVMEVSSQALKYDRVVDLGLDLACFLNIGHDHISPIEHPDFEDYFASKLRIFDQARVAVVNLATDHLDQVLDHARACQRVLTFLADPARKASGSPGPDVWATDVRYQGTGTRFLAHTPTWEGQLSLRMPGDFNVENALCALAVCAQLGIPQDQVRAGLARASVPGRMEVLPLEGGRIVGVVDFAHNQMAFSKFFPAVTRQFPDRTLVSVFGAVGDKALERRIELPQEAAPWSDHMIYTLDDPGTEPVEDICQQMVDATPEESSCEVVVDRKEAIVRSLDWARHNQGPRGALVCLLARGTEPTQHIGHSFVPYPLDATVFLAAAQDLGLSSEL